MNEEDRKEIKRREKKRKIIDSQIIKDYKKVIDKYLCAHPRNNI